MSASSSRRFRPQRFADVLGQDPIVQALKNAIRSRRLAQAYLLSGERGTGKTTLARLIAKALNCAALTPEGEPCSKCSSCLEIASGTSLEVIELDGASHRGIEDIRTITEGISFGIGPTGYKVVIVDEVHMLTKEAFNALLKTLEEPPPRCLFIFATTEAHKVLPTIVSRCQRFHLHRIPRSLVIQKLQRIAKDLDIPIEQGALDRIADRAEGGMRDGESLLDQVIAFADGKVTEKDVETVFGLPSKASYEQLDRAVQSGDFAFPFTLVEELYQEGKHLIHFFEGLVDHFRTIIRTHLQGTDRPPYRKEQAMSLFSDLVRRLDLFRGAHHPRVFLEETLLHIIRSRYVLPVDLLVKRLEALEQSPQPVALQQAQPPVAYTPAPPSFEPIMREPPKPISASPAPPKQTHTFSPREETLLQFAAIELEGIIKR